MNLNVYCYRWKNAWSHMWKIPMPVTYLINCLYWIQANALIQILLWIMTSSGPTQCPVICLKCWHNIHRVCLSTLHLPVGQDTCDHTTIIKVVPVQLVHLQNRHLQWTVDIKTEFSDVLEISFHSTELPNCKVY